MENINLIPIHIALKHNKNNTDDKEWVKFQQIRE
jgi:hypothetical protein